VRYLDFGHILDVQTQIDMLDMNFRLAHQSGTFPKLHKSARQLPIPDSDSDNVINVGPRRLQLLLERLHFPYSYNWLTCS